MKRVLFLVILIVMFPLIVLADSSCGIEKDNSEDYILKSGDVTTVYIYTTINNESPKISSLTAQLYYNPYVFELLEDFDNKFFFLNEGWSETSSKKYSSILKFQISGSDLTIPLLKYDSSNILTMIKFKVKNNVKSQNTTIELIGDGNTYIKSINASDSNVFDINCDKTILSYEINNNATVNTKDSKLSSVYLTASDDRYVYMTPEFNPIITSYTVYTEGEEIYISGKCASRVCTTTSSNTKLKKGSNIIKIKSTFEDSNTIYTFNVIREDTENEFYYPVLNNIHILNYSTIEEFNPYYNTYHLMVPSSESSLFIDYDTDDVNTVHIYNNENFVYGENIVIIEVSDFKGNYKNKYYLIVNKTQEVDDEKTIIEEQKQNKEEYKQTNNKIYIMFVIFMSLFVVGYVVFEILFNKKNIIKKK
ncbi:MAG: hypothetical protein GX758_04400 [Tenericutes bacterium]|nr:hypothetical protein [Mycoplasmatota bacterium]